MSKSLILDSLEIRNFRAFRHLRIERLGRVNLIAGKNNVGKTCLLEALRLYVHWLSIRQILEARNELGPLPRNRMEDAAELIGALKYLFYGRRDVTTRPEPIQIGPLHSRDDTSSIALEWKESHPLDLPELVIHVGAQWQARYPPGKLIRYGWSDDLQTTPKIHHVFLPADGLNERQVGQLWDDTALTDLEDDVLAALRIIAPKVKRVNLVGQRDSTWERIPMVRILQLEEPIPLRSLGEGMNRLFGISLALVNAKDGLLLVDEIDSGLHYSVQPDLWRLVFQVARRLNVQVFATTHSWDCVKAFQQAAQEDAEADGMYIRLENRKGEIVPILFDEDKLGIAAREEIEIR